MPLQATNAGIDYQCRVSAWFLLNMIFENKLSSVISSYPDSIITSAQLEGRTEIDDFIIDLENKQKIYFQMKRNIQFSILESSEFYKVINQFIKQSLLNNSRERYILATSSKSSKKIIDKLRRILDSIRISSVAEVKKQFNKNDEKLWKEFCQLCKVIFKQNTGEQLNEDRLVNIVSKIYIDIFDIEDGEAYEKLVYMFIKSNTDFNTKLLWNTLIKYSLTLASNRRSISLDKIKKEFQVYLNMDIDLDKNVDENISEVGIEQVWKDYIVAIPSSDFIKEINFKENSLLIFDIYRFNDDGKKKLIYELPDNVQILDIGKFKVLFRGASLLGVERYIASNKNKLQEFSEICFLPAKYSEEYNTFEKMHVELTKRELDKNIKNKECVICGDIYNDEKGFIVEVDNTFEPNEIGLCHIDCLRPIDRVLGIASTGKNELKPYLNNFDVKKWIEIIDGGQGMVSGLSSIKENIVDIAWNPTNSFINGKYCVKNKLENGENIYTKDRGKVDRMSKQAAKRLARKFDENHKKAYKTNNPICYSSESYAYGRYEVLKNVVDTSEEKIIPCIGSKIDMYSKHLSTLFNTCKNYYAPLIMFYVDDKKFEIDNMIPLISNPLDIKYYYENWKEYIESKKNNMIIRIIENDSDFDNIVRDIYDKGKFVVINPRLGLNNELISGAKLIKSLY